MTRKEAIYRIILSFIVLIVSVFTFNLYKKRKDKILYAINTYEDLIAEIAEIIIPTSSSPGAKEAGAAIYIINILENCTSKQNLINFKEGLEDVKKYSLNKFSMPFLNCNNEDKLLIVQHFAKESFTNPILKRIKKKTLGLSFFEQMKTLTISGYCISKLGATKGLAYDYVPYDYNSCIPLTQGQKSWATK